MGFARRWGSDYNKKAILLTLSDMRAGGVDYVAGFVRVLRLEGDPAPFSWLKHMTRTGRGAAGCRRKPLSFPLRLLFLALLSTDSLWLLWASLGFSGLLWISLGFLWVLIAIEKP